MASALVVRQLASFGPSLDSEEAVRDALNVCNDAVYAAADGNPELVAMGTTVAGAVVLAESLLAFNVGDSRVLDATGDGLRQVSVDDSPPLAPGRLHHITCHTGARRRPPVQRHHAPRDDGATVRR